MSGSQFQSRSIEFFIGRLQPPHEEHLATIISGIDRALTKQPLGEFVLLLGSCNIAGNRFKNPWTFFERQKMVMDALADHYKSNSDWNLVFRVEGVSDYSSDSAWKLAVQFNVVKLYLSGPTCGALPFMLEDPRADAQAKGDFIINYFAGRLSSEQLARAKPLVEEVQGTWSRINRDAGIQITGFEKDESSYYLKTIFPELPFISTEHKCDTSLDATQIRVAYWNQRLYRLEQQEEKEVVIPSHRVARCLPPAVLAFLVRFKQTESLRFEQVQEDRLIIEREKTRARATTVFAAAALAAQAKLGQAEVHSQEP